MLLLCLELRVDKIVHFSFIGLYCLLGCLFLFFRGSTLVLFGLNLGVGGILLGLLFSFFLLLLLESLL